MVSCKEPVKDYKYRTWRRRRRRSLRIGILIYTRVCIQHLIYMYMGASIPVFAGISVAHVFTRICVYTNIKRLLNKLGSSSHFNRYKIEGFLYMYESSLFLFLSIIKWSFPCKYHLRSVDKDQFLKKVF